MSITGFKVRLIAGWKEAWRWSSVRFLALGGVVEATLIATPSQVTAHVPEWVMTSLSVFALFCILAAGVGRITAVEKTDALEKPAAAG